MIASSSTGLWVCHQIHIRLSFGMYKHQCGKDASDFGVLRYS